MKRGWHLLLVVGGWGIAFGVRGLPVVGEESYQESRQLPPLHHVVEVPLPETMKMPERLPLRGDRKLRCPTCHGISDIDKLPYRRVDRKAPEFLRGGPYPRLERFCYQCHDEKRFRRPNVHRMVDANGKLKEEHCTYCHEEVHEQRDRPLRRADYRLRLPPEKLCYGCHLKTPHFNAVEHQESKPPARMRLHMKESQARYGVLLPLSLEGKVMCPTCHTPHQYGVLDAATNPAGKQVANHDLEEGIRYRDHPWDEVIREDKKERLAEWNRNTGEHLELGYRRIEREVLLRLPAQDGTLCLACHQFDR